MSEVAAIDGTTGGVRKRPLELGSDIPGTAKAGQKPSVVKSEIARGTPIVRAAAIKTE